jgi:hypothetical protein
MAGFGDIPRSELINLANANRVRAAEIEFGGPAVGIFFKVEYQNGRGAVLRIPATFAIMFAEHIEPIAKKRGWQPVTPPRVVITDADKAEVGELPQGGKVESGHVVILDDAVILVPGFEKNLGLCLRVGRNHAAWFADRILRGRDQGLLTDLRDGSDTAPRVH